jgi:hypothetical protein
MDMHATYMGEMRKAYSILVENPEGKKPFRRQEIIGTIILKLILRK